MQLRRARGVGRRDWFVRVMLNFMMVVTGWSNGKPHSLYPSPIRWVKGIIFMVVKPRTAARRLASVLCYSHVTPTEFWRRTTSSPMMAPPSPPDCEAAGRGRHLVEHLRRFDRDFHNINGPTQAGRAYDAQMQTEARFGPCLHRNVSSPTHTQEHSHHREKNQICRRQHQDAWLRSDN